MNIKVAKIKKSLSKSIGVPISNQILYWNDKELTDNMRGKEFNLGAETILVLVDKDSQDMIKTLQEEASPKRPSREAPAASSQNESNLEGTIEAVKRQKPSPTKSEDYHSLNEDELPRGMASPHHHPTNEVPTYRKQHKIEQEYKHKKERRESNQQRAMEKTRNLKKDDDDFEDTLNSLQHELSRPKANKQQEPLHSARSSPDNLEYRKPLKIPTPRREFHDSEIQKTKRSYENNMVIESTSVHHDSPVSFKNSEQSTPFSKESIAKHRSTEDQPPGFVSQATSVVHPSRFNKSQRNTPRYSQRNTPKGSPDEESKRHYPSQPNSRGTSRSHTPQNRSPEDSPGSFVGSPETVHHSSPSGDIDMNNRKVSSPKNQNQNSPPTVFDLKDIQARPAVKKSQSEVQHRPQTLYAKETIERYHDREEQPREWQPTHASPPRTSSQYSDYHPAQRTPPRPKSRGRSRDYRPGDNYQSPYRRELLQSSSHRSPRKMSTKATLQHMKKEKEKITKEFELQFQLQLKEEQAHLMRLFTTSKKKILEQANKDRQELARENAKLRKKLANARYNNSDRRASPEKDHFFIQKIEDLEMQLADQEEYAAEQIRHLETENNQLKAQANHASPHQAIPQRDSNQKGEINVLKQQLAVQKEKQDELMEQMNHKFEQERQRMTEEHQQDASDMQHHYSHLNEQYEDLMEQYRHLSQSLSVMESQFEREKVFSSSAKQVILELQDKLNEALQGDLAAATQIVDTTTRASEAEYRVQVLEELHTKLNDRLQMEIKKRKAIHNKLEDLKGSIRVIIRIRPLLPNENLPTSLSGKVDLKNDSTVTITTAATGVKSYEFYRALGEKSSQLDIFNEVSPLLQSAIDGFNVCVMAYGQTGSGKTYTIHGGQGGDSRGVLPRAADELFDLLEKNNIQSPLHEGEDYNGDPSKSEAYSLSCSMIELYRDDIRDILLDANDEHHGQKLDIREHPKFGTFVQGVSKHPVNSPAELLAYIDQGNRVRQIQKTSVHDRSSRSHTIFTIHLRVYNNAGEREVISRSKLQFVDLAGSERVSRSNAKGARFKEAQHINKSLSALGDVISSLSRKKNYTPYRNSKLTQVLRSCLGGNSKTLMFANISPSAECVPETLTTLVFASRAKRVQNRASKNR